MVRVVVAVVVIVVLVAVVVVLGRLRELLRSSLLPDPNRRKSHGVSSTACWQKKRGNLAGFRVLSIFLDCLYYFWGLFFVSFRAVSASASASLPTYFSKQNKRTRSTQK